MASSWRLILMLCMSIYIVQSSEVKAWWKTASFYQIYPRSFKDSNGDGIGDLNGVTAKLEYLKEIGVTATWLSPFLKSPMADFGYDISNFTDVDITFGDMNDFDNMMKRANELNIKIILDFVPNHSSDECEWFIKSAARDPEYVDFYIWHPGRIVNGTRDVPSNWMSVFRGSAWTWHEGRQEYYLHQFHRKQPDFNFRNPKVRETLNEILRFWLRRGVAGFRVDAVDWAYEVLPDADGNYPDEPRSDWNNDPEDYNYVQHIYTNNLPETKLLAYEWRSVLDKHWDENGGEERILMIETWTGLDSVMEYYGNQTAEGGQIPFNFQMIMNLWQDSNAYHYAELINGWLSNMPEGRTANWVIGNHDKNRVASRYGRERVDMFNILLLTLPGCSITYMGEEIGMTDVWISWNDTVDPQACNGYEENYESASRDPARTPFQWSDEAFAGFTTGNRTWLPISQNYTVLNVKVQRGKPLSHLNIFKQLQALRSKNTLRSDEATVEALNSNVLGVKRYLSGDYTYVTLLNIFNQVETVDLNWVFSDVPEDFEYVLITSKSMRRIGDKVKSKSITLLANESVVLKSLVRS